MLDINFVRDNLDLVTTKLRTRGFSTEVLDRFSQLETQRRSNIRKVDDLKAVRNRESQEIGTLMKAGRKEDAESRRQEVRRIGEEIAERETALNAIKNVLNDLMIGLPNLPHDSVPVGQDESANQEITRWGTPRIFDFEPRDHVDLGTALGILDLERAAKISGARFAILTGLGARLERALINFCLELQTKRHGYEEVLPPFIVTANTLFGTGQLPKFEADLFKLTDERGLYLIPTAEVPLTNIYSDEILDGARLPIKMTAYTPCFRSEAGIRPYA